MKEKQELEDEEGMTVETRVISSSVSMMVKSAGKNKELVKRVFEFFAVFPEDVPVPAPFLNKMVPLLSDEKNEKKARVALGSCLSTLLKYNLIKGTLMAGSGVFMHDIVRDYVIAQHPTEGLHALQRRVVGAVLAARPEPDGFPSIEHAKLGSFEEYTARHLYWHVKGSLQEDEEPPDALIEHRDGSVKVGLAMALGLDAVVSLSKAREEAGMLVSAAHARRAASLLKGISASMLKELLWETADLL